MQILGMRCASACVCARLCVCVGGLGEGGQCVDLKNKSADITWLEVLQLVDLLLLLVSCHLFLKQ